MKNIFFIILFIIFCSSISVAQKKLYFYADYALFKNTDSKSTVEIYFSVNQRDLRYTKTEENFLAQANIEVSIFDKGKNKPVFDDFFGLQSKVTDTNKQSLNNKLIGQQNFSLSTGDYLFKLVGSDNFYKEKCDTLTFDINIAAFDSSKTGLSDIQISSTMEKSKDSKSVFYKNGLEITPNPDALFGMNLNTIFYYLEIYSINKDFGGDSNYIITTISDLSNNIIRQDYKSELSKYDAFFETGKISIDSLDKGVYLFKVKLMNTVTGKSLEKEKKFFVYNKSKNIASDKSDDKSYLKSEYESMNSDKIDDEYAKSIYIRTTPETDEYNKLNTLDEKRKYMYFFWQRRQTVPNSPVNDYKIAYFKRVSEANSLFKQGFMEGWKTDRGRIYITYGKPSDIENHPNEAESKGYEIWTYDAIQGGAICVFAERELGAGMYYLVNSTIRGEFRDDNWKSRLNKSSNSNNNN